MLVLSPEVCDRARMARDQRFDGRFFTGVLTTGIYCRPICPVRPAKRENVRFYPSAAAAAADGFRPCLRCRPESAPGTPAWIGSAATVSRAIALINLGFFDEAKVEDLAARLGITSRHLCRLFSRYLGASPTAIARTRRVQIAKLLLTETSLPITEVAFAAGFASIRRFNAVFREVYGNTPTMLRRHAKVDTTLEDGIELYLSYRPPFCWQSLADMLARESTPGVEEVGTDYYRRTVAVGSSEGVLEVSPSSKNRLAVRLRLTNYAGLRAVIEKLTRIFDLNADPESIERDLRCFPDLQKVLTASRVPRLPGVWDGLELAMRSTIASKMGTKRATTLMGRLVESYGKRIDTGEGWNGPTYLFPSPEGLSSAAFSSLGLPDQVADRLRALAVATASGCLRYDGEQDFDEVVHRIMELTWLDEPTANWIAMRGAGNPDACPFGAPQLPDRLRQPVALTPHSTKAWSPWRSYVALLLAGAWNRLEYPVELK